MTIAEAIRTAAAASNWNATRVAVEAGVTEAAARRWMKNTAMPEADKLERLRAKLPGLSKLLDARSAAA